MNFHPDEELLSDYASGTLPVAVRLIIEAHRELCDSCADDITMLELAGGVLLADLPEALLAEGALERALAALGKEAVSNTSSKERRALPWNLKLPAAIADAGLRPRRWLAPGLWAAIVETPAAEGWRLFLLQVPAGWTVPAHNHRGDEMVCVLEGRYTDGDRWRGPGDFVRAGAAVEHELKVSDDAPCLCLIATQAPPQWKGVAKLLNPLLGLS